MTYLRLYRPRCRRTEELSHHLSALVHSRYLRENKSNFKRKTTYDLVVAHNCHDTERLHAVALRVEGGAAALVAKDHVRMNISIQVWDSKFLHVILESSFALATRVIGAPSRRVVGTITVDVHVIIVSGASLEEDGVGDVAAVAGATAEASRQLLGAGSRLLRAA